MAAVLNSLFGACLVFSVFTACAKEEVQSSVTVDAYNIARDQYERAKHELEEAIARCDIGRKSIPAYTISPLGLTMDQAKVALFVLNARAELRCEKGTREGLFYAAGIYRATAKHYGRDSGDAVQYDEEKMLSHVWMQLEFEAEYLLIDKEVRATLESLEATQVPFKIFETLDGINGE
jgi:hypothetical protein